jgi:hypothetical protein
MVCFDSKLPSNPIILRMALEAPTRFRNEMPKEAQFHVICDSGASVTVTPHRLDFVGHYSKPPISIRLKGLAKGLNIAGQGHVMWLIMDTTGIISLGRVPLVWHSQLQSEISLSTLESEYSSLLQAMHTLLPICSLLMEVVPAIRLQNELLATIHARVHLPGKQWSLLVGYKPMYYPLHKVLPSQVTFLLECSP